jgi:transcription antitermination factor NusB
MGNRRKARELATQILFHMEFNPGDPDEVCDLICDNFNSAKSIRAFSRKLVCGVRENIEYLDKLIGESSENWRLERMPIMDRSILRLGAYEILFMKDIPPKVTIDEAVELGKKYSTEESGAFINGVLDYLFNKHSDVR